MREAYPKLRPLDIRPFRQDGQTMLLLRDPLELTDQLLGLPQPLAPLLGLCDGTRDLVGIHTALSIRWGIRVSRQTINQLVEMLDEACLLDNERSAEAMHCALSRYRDAPNRPPSLAGGGYPADAEALTGFLDSFDCRDVSCGRQPSSTAPIRGVVSPHIDYARGGPVYRAVWSAAAEAARAADLAVIFGTDHLGGPGSITVTRQSYATPYGLLPTAIDVVDAVVNALGEKSAFAEELHHRSEHSIELASVWLHYVRQGRGIEIAPILCGSFAHFIAGQADPAHDPQIEGAIAALRKATEGRNLLVVAAADLAHVGPAFGGPPFDPPARAELRLSDAELLDIVASGNADGFFAALRSAGDRNNVCGLPPIYLALRFLGDARGETIAYDQCRADEADTSWVSVAGTVWR